ncbi:hypothetical protein AAHH78_38140, partial [Burkholderia pseudomallei]
TIAQATPEQLANTQASFTGNSLAPRLTRTTTAECGRPGERPAAAPAARGSRAAARACAGEGAPNSSGQPADLPAVNGGFTG